MENQRSADRKLTEEDHRRIEGVVPLVWKTAKKDANVINMPINDIASECFLALARSTHRYDPARAKYTTFAMWIMRGWRSKLMWKQVHSAQYEYREFDGPDDLPDYDEAVTDDVFAIAGMHLSDAESAMLDMSIREGLCWRTIARRIGTTRHLVTDRFHSIYRRLREVVTLQELADVGAADARTTGTGDDMLPDGVAAGEEVRRVRHA